MSRPADVLTPRPDYLEMRQTFRAMPDGGRNLEVAMAVQIFHRLQEAGLIDPDARPSSRVPNVPGFESTTYEARLVELIRDHDDNGRLEIDLVALARAGITTKSVVPPALERHLSDHSMEAPSLSFFMKTSRKSDLVDYGFTDKGRDVQSLTQGLRLESSAQRAADAFLRDVPARIANGEAAAVAEQALAAATFYEQTHKPEVARTMLANTANALRRAGRREEAVRVLRALTKAPHASVEQHIGRHFLERMEGLRFDPDVHDAVFGDGGNRTTVDVNKFRSTIGRVASIRIAQLEIASGMEAVLGRPADPFRAKDVGTYFDALSKTSSTTELAAELGRYLKAHFVHAGEGVTWSKSVPIDERPDRVDELIADQPSDAVGRRLIDCECFSYLADAVFSAIETKAGPRFAVSYVQRPGHITALVVDRTNRRAFGVDNEEVEGLGELTSKEDMVVAAGRLIVGRATDMFRIASTPGDAKTADDEGLPRTGSVAWDDGFVGVVDDRVRAHYAAAMKAEGKWIPFSTYLARLAAR